MATNFTHESRIDAKKSGAKLPHSKALRAKF